MADLLALSSRIIDEGWDPGRDGPTNRTSGELSEVADGIALVEAFSHVVALDSGDGLVLFDTSLAAFAPLVVPALRAWRREPVHTIVYTHGHVDHVGGTRAILDEAAAAGHRPPRIVAHEAVPLRFDRYAATRGWQQAINARQFGPARQLASGMPDGFDGFVDPDVTFDDSLTLRAGDLVIELHHDRGETDDHAWAWLPAQRALCTGDFLTWVFPNAGNPQKVQRYPLDWATALRRMAARRPELLLPAHGLPIEGADRIEHVLDRTATTLEALVAGVVDRMNEGARLDEIIRAVRVPDDVLELPWLQPVYDEPEFVVRNIYRQYGGWWDGDPASLKPAPAASLARELADAAGGALALAERGSAAAERGDLRLACHLVELAAQAEPANPAVHERREAVYEQRRRAERSLMAKGVFRTAALESRALLDAAWVKDAPPAG
jgi:alkyl sulfatase BDS1-like metallo-beta-lactamase superfamily hydrolase